jgi:hypothetical protein
VERGSARSGLTSHMCTGGAFFCFVRRSLLAEEDARRLFPRATFEFFTSSGTEKNDNQNPTTLERTFSIKRIIKKN